MRPLLKWTGSKQRVVDTLCQHMPARIEQYVEPFAGSAALFFELSRRNQLNAAIINDVNPHLIQFYREIRDDYVGVHRYVNQIARQHSEATYYKIRSLVNDCNPIRPACGGSYYAACFWYLNRAGYNGMWRVNRAGKQNVPSGKKKKVTVPALADFHTYAMWLQRAELRCVPYRESLQDVRPDGVVYFDPPYVDTFTSYAKDGFGEAAHVQLAQDTRNLVEAGAHVVVSINDCTLARELYDDGRCQLHELTVYHAVGAKAERRKDVAELLVEVKV